VRIFFECKCEVFSPNALGAVINDETIDLLNCDIVAGAANNVLAEPRHGVKAFLTSCWRFLEFQKKRAYLPIRQLSWLRKG